MIASRVFSRISGSSLNQCRGLLLSSRSEHSPLFSCNFHGFHYSSNKWVPSQVNLLHRIVHRFQTPIGQRFGISSSASPQPTERESNQSGGDGRTSSKDKDNDTSTDAESTKTSSDASVPPEYADLSINDLVKLVVEKDELLKMKDKEIEIMKEKFLLAYAEMENIAKRTKREAENSIKFAVQNFAKSLLDVADNLRRASAAVRHSFSKIDASKDTSGAVPLLKTLLEGVEMTEKQLAEVFRKFGVEKFDPIKEPFDPNRHNAVFQIPDPSKPLGTVAVVLKPGYMIHDRVLRPADVGVTTAVDSSEADKTYGT